MATNEPMTGDMLTDGEREIITEEYIRSVKRELAEALAEVDRLRAREQALAAENAVMRPVVEYVASHTAWPNFRADLYMCLFCDGAASRIADIKHGANCYAEQARAFVAAHPATDTAAEIEGE